MKSLHRLFPRLAIKGIAEFFSKTNHVRITTGLCFLAAAGLKSENEAVSLLSPNESVLTVMRSQFKKVLTMKKTTTTMTIAKS